MDIESIKASGLTKRYGNHRALANVELTLQRGKVCALLGPNGAGKSTLLGILSTLVRPTVGQVVYRSGEGEVPHGVELRSKIGVLAHESLVYSALDALENLRFFGQLYEVANLEERIAALLDEVGLQAAARKRTAQTYSRGMLQRLAVARALLPDPSILLFDEPFTGLDRHGTQTLTTTLENAKNGERIVVVVTHDLAPLDGLADHVVILRGGKVAFEETRANTYSGDELKDLYAEHSSE